MKPVSLDILGVHGIGVLDPYGLEWAAAAVGGLPLPLPGYVRVREGRWPSTGSRLVDAARIVGDRRFRRRCIRAVAMAEHEHASEHPRGVTVAHSMGAALILAARRQLAEDGEAWAIADRPLLLIGPPASRVLRPALAAAGVWRPPPGPAPVLVWNVDDPVNGRRPLLPSWCRCVRVALGNAPKQDEHSAALYLSHPLVGAELAHLAAWSAL